MSIPGSLFFPVLFSGHDQESPTTPLQKQKARSSRTGQRTSRTLRMRIYYAIDFDLIDFDRYVPWSASAKLQEQQQAKLRKRIMKAAYRELLLMSRENNDKYDHGTQDKLAQHRSVKYSDADVEVTFDNRVRPAWTNWKLSW